MRHIVTLRIFFVKQRHIQEDFARFGILYLPSGAL
jgi:hypothetical protein